MARGQASTGAPSTAHAGSAERVTVYLVTDLTGTGLIYDRYLRPNEVVLLAGTVEEELRADAMLRELTLRVGDGNVTVIDLRTPVAASGEAGAQNPLTPRVAMRSRLITLESRSNVLLT